MSNQYSEAAFQWVTSEAEAIKQTATTLGISPMVLPE